MVNTSKSATNVFVSLKSRSIYRSFKSRETQTVEINLSYLTMGLQKFIFRFVLSRRCSIFCTCSLWQYGLWSFQTGDTKWERFLPKNQHTQRKFLNFENWTNGEVSKSAKSPNLLTFKVNINLGAHFLLSTFFVSINF